MEREPADGEDPPADRGLRRDRPGDGLKPARRRPTPRVRETTIATRYARDFHRRTYRRRGPKTAAVDAAAGQLAYDGPHAPIAPAWRILSPHYSPLLAAVQVHSVRDRLPAAEQLMFRTSHTLPRYPAATTPDSRRPLRLPEHRPHLPESDPSWILQSLWWNAVPGAFTGCRHPTLVRSLLTMALAKVGSICRWSTICGDLHLPASHAQRVERLLRYLHRAGLWPEVLVGLQRLMAGLQQHPPPIDYPARRTLGDDLELLDEAIRAGCQVHPSLAPTETLVQQF